MSYNYNILRTGKVKSKSQITNAAEHNFRLRIQTNIDGSKSHLNQLLFNSLDVSTKDATDLQKKLTEHYLTLGIKEKKDNVLMMEFVVSASPDFFSKKSSPEINKWADHQVKFFKKEFGDQLKIAVLHLDEKTPHIHFMVSTEQKTKKVYKNRYGTTEKETWSLNAKRYNPEFLRELHDRHAEHNKKLGLRRGVKGSMRKHKSLKEFYAIVDKALGADYGKAIEKIIDTLEVGVLSKKVSIDEIREKFKPMFNKMLKQNKALKEKYALDIKQWATDISLREEQLKIEKEETENLKKHYGDGIRKRMELEDQLKQEKKRSQALAEELDEVKKKLPQKEAAVKLTNKREMRI